MTPARDFRLFDIMRVDRIVLLARPPSRTHSAIDRVQIDLGLLRPFIPEVGIIQRNVCAVPGGYKTGLE